jgi:hypothetical protein
MLHARLPFDLSKLVFQAISQINQETVMTIAGICDDRTVKDEVMRFQRLA